MKLAGIKTEFDTLNCVALNVAFIAVVPFNSLALNTIEKHNLDNFKAIKYIPIFTDGSMYGDGPTSKLSANKIPNLSEVINNI